MDEEDEGYLSSTDASWCLRWITDTLLFDNQVNHREVRTERGDRLTDREEKGGNGERRNVRSGALEAILAGNLSYHSDPAKALQQEERDGHRKSVKESKRDLEVLCL